MEETWRWQSTKPLPCDQPPSSFVDAKAYVQSLQPCFALFLKNNFKVLKKLETRKKE